MKWLALAACMTLMCLPVSATTSHKRKTTHKETAATSTRRGSSSVKHTRAAVHHAEESNASLHTAKYSPATTQSSSTAKHSSKKRKSTKGSRHARREPSQMAPTQERISEIQTALGRGGYYTADPSGKWDSDTVDAVQKFQSANGLDVTGKLDALTLQKLGLGSDVAGVSAPKGITPHSCCSITPSPSYAPPTSSAPQTSSPAAPVTSSASNLPPVESSQK